MIAELESSYGQQRDAPDKGHLTAWQVVDIIKVKLGVPWKEKTFDVWKGGDPDTPVTGIATTHLAT